MRLYRETRQAAKQYLTEIRQAGYKQVRVEGDNDLTEVCCLTCLEQGVDVVDDSQAPLPTLKVEGMDLLLLWPANHVPRSTLEQDAETSAATQAVGGE